MNSLTPYAALFMRLAVGGVFLKHGFDKFQRGVAGVAGFLHSLGLPLATILAVILIAIERVGAVCVLLGIFTRLWAMAMAVVMVRVWPAIFPPTMSAQPTSEMTRPKPLMMAANTAKRTSCSTVNMVRQRDAPWAMAVSA